jgi:hypothetical protein
MKKPVLLAVIPVVTRFKKTVTLRRLSYLPACSIIAAVCLFSGTAQAAQTNSMTLTINASDPGPAIPSDFIGASVSSWNIDDDQGYTKYFQTSNTQIVNLFQQIGIKHLRTIMGNATNTDLDPSDSEIDAFFDFAAAVGVQKVIWSLHLFNAEVATNWANNEAIAQHIWTTTTTNGTVEKDMLDSFAFDNEPDWLGYICCTDPNITSYGEPSDTGGYRGMWSLWQQDIAGLAPGAQFSGPDTGSKWPCPGEVDTAVTNVPFTLQFSRDESSVIAFASQHLYAGGSAGTQDALELAETCLSSNMITTNYTIIQNNIVSNSPVLYRFTECSAFDDSGNTNNQIFATALWGLDCFNWFARHGWLGVDPFTRCAQYNSPIYLDDGNYIAEPYAYAMKAFNLGSDGNVIYTSKFLISNPGNINVTAYGVVNSTDLYVTIVNKTFNTVGSRAAQVSIPAPAGFTVQHAQYIVLSGGPTAGSSGNATMFGACLGGAEIPNDGSDWAGTWTNLSVTNGGTSLLVQPTTAVVIDLQDY